LERPPRDTLPLLSLLAEVMASKPLPGSLDLVSRLLETLSKVVQASTSTEADVAYIEQSLMTAIENAATNITVTYYYFLQRNVAEL
jgi:U3 small nucleolar RNA-associated protein 10